MEFNHTRPLEDFQDQIDIIKNHGFKVLGVSQMMFEDTFIFATKEEATRAYELLEKGDKGDKCLVVGWWYGKDDYEKSIEEYRQETGTKVLTHWINEN